MKEVIEQTDTGGASVSNVEKLAKDLRIKPVRNQKEQP